MSFIPYLISDGNTGVLVSNTGKYMQAEQALEELVPSLSSLILVWISPGQAQLISLPPMRKWKVDKCLKALNDDRFYALTKEVESSDDECIYLHCQAAKADLEMCLFRLRTCNVQNVIPFEMFLWRCCRKNTVTSLTWNGITYAVYKNGKSTQLMQFKILSEDSDGVLEHFALRGENTIHCNLRDAFSPPSESLSGYAVKNTSVRVSAPSLGVCLFMASTLFFIGAVFIHIKRNELAINIVNLEQLYEQQSHLHQQYQKDKKAYEALSESIHQLESVAWSNFRSKQVVELIHRVDDIPVSSLSLDSDIGEIAAKWSLRSKDIEARERFIKKVQLMAVPLGNSCQFEINGDFLGLIIACSSSRFER